jgi:hypothetical protein
LGLIQVTPALLRELIAVSTISEDNTPHLPWHSYKAAILELLRYMLNAMLSYNSLYPAIG